MGSRAISLVLKAGNGNPAHNSVRDRRKRGH